MEGWLTTRRLLLRPWENTEEEARRLYEMAKDPAIGPAAGWQPHKSVEESRKILRNILCTPEIYAVLPKRTGQPCGAAGITYGRTGRKWLGEKEAEIGYWICTREQGQGFAREAAAQLLRRCFTDLHRSAVWAAYYEGNDRSRRVQEACGFVYDHTEEDSYVEALGEHRTEHFMKLTRKEWLRRQAVEDPGKAR